MPQEDPPRIQELPKQGAAVLPQIPYKGLPLSGRRMSVDTDSFEHFVSLEPAFSPGTQDGDFVSVRVKRPNLLEDAGIGRDRLVFYDDEYFSLHVGTQAPNLSQQIAS